MDNINKEIDRRNNLKDQLRQNVYYILIFSISLIILLFFPMLGSELGLAFNLPDSKAGWVLYIVTKLFTAIFNVFIFYSFIKQGETNSKSNPKYIKAMEIVATNKPKEYHPRSPKKWRTDTYLRKGIGLAIGIVTGLVALPTAILSYDILLLITYAITVAITIIFGVMTMMNTEIYWCEEFYDYAITLQKGNKENDKL